MASIERFKKMRKEIQDEAMHRSKIETKKPTPKPKTKTKKCKK